MLEIQPTYAERQLLENLADHVNDRKDGAKLPRVHARLASGLAHPNGDNCRSLVMLCRSKARAQGWHPRSLAAGKQREIKGGFVKPQKSGKNPGSPGGPFQAGFSVKISDYFSQKKASSFQQLEQSRLLFFSPSVVPKRVSRKLAGDPRAILAKP